METIPKQVKQETMKDKFYKILSEEFSRKEAVELGAQIISNLARSINI